MKKVPKSDIMSKNLVRKTDPYFVLICHTGRSTKLVLLLNAVGIRRI